MVYLGLDSGTQSTKCIALDAETGQVLASAHSSYGMVPGLPPGHLEQHPEAWLDAADAAVRGCLEQIGGRRAEVRAIGVSGQQHGLVALNADNEPVRPAKLWCDTSTAAQCEQFNHEFGADEIIALTGNSMLPGYTAPKILWLKQNEPANFRALRSILLPHDYLNFWLTGEQRMEYGDASGTALLDVRTRQWSEPILQFIDPDLVERLPPLESSRKPCGLLRETLRMEWGLGSNVLVSAGGGDNMMAAIGTGNVAPGGVVTVSLGTSGTLFAYSAEPVVDEEGELAAFCDSTDAWLPLACTMNVTVATEQARHLFGWDHAAMEAAVAATAPGAGGLLFLPYLNGERTPNLPRGSGVLHGLNTHNMTPAFYARAVMEGVTLGLGYGLGRFRNLGIKPSEIRLTGGGSQSAAWRQICADVFNVPVVTLETAEGAALGAAIQAGWTEGAVQGKKGQLRELVNRVVKPAEGTRAEPDPGRRQLYQDLQFKQTEMTRRLHSGGFPVKFVVAATGASGAIYTERLLMRLDPRAHEVHLVLSTHSKQVAAEELPAGRLTVPDGVRVHEDRSMHVPFASGSARFDAMVIVPCSMGTVGRIAAGTSESTILRAADVFLKERRKLILVPRETPWSLVHARNVVAVTEAGALVLPAIPSFYHRPATVEEVVDTVVFRILDHLGVAAGDTPRWQED